MSTNAPNPGAPKLLPVKVTAQVINGVLLAVTVVALLYLAFRLFAPAIGTPDQLLSVLSLWWVLLLPLTVFHLIASRKMVAGLRTAWHTQTSVERQKLYTEVTTSVASFMWRMRPRLLPKGGGPAPMTIDPATIATYLAAAAIASSSIVATINSLLGNTSLFQLLVLILIVINWGLGSKWAIGLSELTVNDPCELQVLKRTVPESVLRCTKGYRGKLNVLICYGGTEANVVRDRLIAWLNDDLGMLAQKVADLPAVADDRQSMTTSKKR